MMKNILKSLFVAVALVAGSNIAFADNITATLVHTASSYCETDASDYVRTVDS